MYKSQLRQSMAATKLKGGKMLNRLIPFFFILFFSYSVISIWATSSNTAGKAPPHLVVDRSSSSSTTSDDDLLKEEEEESANKQQVPNAAFVFLKPHANTPAARELVRDLLAKQKITIKQEISISGKEINADKLIDRHYYSISSKATLHDPSELNVPNDLFKEFFGEDFTQVLSENRALNAMQACEKFRHSELELYEKWRSAESSAKVLKLGGGFYVGLLEFENGEKVYVFNGFFMSMRSKFVHDEAAIYGYEVEWDAAVLSWQDFRGKILGPTNPEDAPVGSIRRVIMDYWASLGLSSKPDKGDNAVHASASPFEGLAERMNWLKRELHDDIFGKELLAKGLLSDFIKTLSVDPHVSLPDDSRGSIFDHLEDLDAIECLDALLEVQKRHHHDQQWDDL